MKTTKSSFLVICLVGLVGSTWLGWSLGGTVGQVGAKANSEAARSGGVNLGQGGRKNLGPPPEVAAALRAIKSSGDLSERIRATIGLAQTLPLAELQRWLEESWFSLRAGPELGIFQVVAKERWSVEDPLGYVAWVKEDDPEEGAEVLAAWIGDDLGRLESYFEEYPDAEFRMGVLVEMATDRPDWALEQALKTKDTADLSDFERLYRKLASESPETLRRARDEIPLGGRPLVESLLSGIRMEESFESEFENLLEKPDGFRLLSANSLTVKGAGDKVLARLGDFPAHWRSELAQSLSYFVEEGNLDQWLATDFEELGFTESQIERMRGTILQTMLRSDPMKALRQLHAIGLSEEERRKFLQNLFFFGKPEELEGQPWREQLAESDLKLVDELEGRGGRERGDRTALSDPEVWLTRVREGQAADSEYEYNEAMREWSGQKIARLAEQFQALHGEERLRVASLLADADSFQRRTAQLRGEAIREVIAAGEELIENSDGGVEAAAKHALSWVINEPANARQWVESLPNGEAKTWARRNMAAGWRNYDPEAMSEWIASLPATARRDVEKYLANEGSD